MDITDVILNDHEQQRRMFAYLSDIDRSNIDSLDAVWTRLRIALEVHAEAEERLFYPHLLKIGTGAGGEGSAVEEVTDVIKDHNEIRDAIKEAAKHAVGSENWWKAAAKTEEANSDHMAEEEREDLADFRHHADWQLRHEIAVAFATFEARHAGGVHAKDQDPARYVEDNS
jgi:hemerythrin superfamily protein